MGSAVALYGDVLAVGVTNQDDQGAVYLFRRDFGGQDNWGLWGNFVGSDGHPGDQFGHSLDIEGEFLIAGSPGSRSVTFRGGAADIFRVNDEVGIQQLGHLIPPDSIAQGEFGVSVGISGGTAIVGARNDSDNDHSGAAYLFAGSAWEFTKKLKASDRNVSDEFGFDVAIETDLALVGAPYSGEQAEGAAYLFQRDYGGPANWAEVKKLVASDAEPQDGFGFALDLTSGTVVVGARTKPVTVNYGAGYVFEQDYGGPGNWGEIVRLTASDGAPHGFLGKRVAVFGTTIVLGARHAAYVFDQPNPTPGPAVGGVVQIPKQGDDGASLSKGFAILAFASLLAALVAGVTEQLRNR